MRRSFFHLYAVSRNFLEPIIVLGGILFYLFFQYGMPLPFLALAIIMIAIILGSYDLFLDTYHSLKKKQYALDYIAILAIVVSLITGEYLVASIIALMISSGRALENYGVSQAKKSLTKLVSRIPSETTLWENDHPGEKIAIANVKINNQIFIRKGEVIPLDGILKSVSAMTDESSLTGEPYSVEKEKGDIIRSGTINTGESIVICVTKIEKDSTYRKIIEMVQKAQGEKAPLIRLADRYSTLFTIITLVIACFAFFYNRSLEGVLAVLVIATPCPLIIATPIALLGGVNAAARKRIIVKKLAVLEVLQRVNMIVFDKTGTITLGQPKVTGIEINDPSFTETDILGIAQAIERNSLHPLAKAVVTYAFEKKAPVLTASEISETIGKGISGKVHEEYYTLSKPQQEEHGMGIEVKKRDHVIARILMEDVLKKDSRPIIRELQKRGYELAIFTGDKRSTAENIATQLGTNVRIEAEMTPPAKQQGIQELKKAGKVIAMIGDGINDAPALALADVGMVFSNEEQTAASEAADIVLLGGDFALASEAIMIGKRTIAIALQSILWGIGLSIFGMILAAFGLIPPLIGAGLQEAIDVAVIINALRASR